MIISHKYKYVYVQLPKTASTAIETELLEYYDGERILLKHDMLHKFLRQASAEEKKYTFFTSIRNPMDITASHYFNLLQDNRITKRTPQKHSIFRKIWGSYRTKTRFDFLRDNGTDFKPYFLKFYKQPYANWSIVDRTKFDHVIRYESMQEDFSALLDKLGIEQVRPIAMANKTKNRNTRVEELFTDPEVRERARKVYGPYFQVFGYQFPSDWPASNEKGNMGLYRFLNVFRSFYWKNLR